MNHNIVKLSPGSEIDFLLCFLYLQSLLESQYLKPTRRQFLIFILIIRGRFYFVV